MNTKRRGPRLWWGALPLLAVGAVLLLLYACNRTPEDPNVNSPPPPKGPDWFKDVTEDSGIKHIYDNGQGVTALTIDGKPILEKDKDGKLLLDKEGNPKLILDKEGKRIGHLAIL